MGTTSITCSHRLQAVGTVEVAVCVHCARVDWFRKGAPLDPAEGMAALFGDYRLVGRLPGLRSPGVEVLVYRVPLRMRARVLDPFPRGVWLQADEALWLSHDGENLLLSPTHPRWVDNLTRGA